MAKQFKCTYSGCKSTFTSINNVSTHVKKVHTKPIKCNLCSFRCGFDSQLRNHKILKHRENLPNTNSCKYNCGRFFSQESELIRHYDQYHSIGRISSGLNKTKCSDCNLITIKSLGSNRFTNHKNGFHNSISSRIQSLNLILNSTIDKDKKTLNNVDQSSRITHEAKSSTCFKLIHLVGDNLNSLANETALKTHFRFHKQRNDSRVNFKVPKN